MASGQVPWGDPGIWHPIETGIKYPNLPVLQYYSELRRASSLAIVAQKRFWVWNYQVRWSKQDHPWTTS